MKVHFNIRFHTKFGESIWITGNAPELGEGDLTRAVLMEYLDNNFWQINIEFSKKNTPAEITYHYFLKKDNNDIVREGCSDRVIETPKKTSVEFQVIDTWNHAGEFENAFYSSPFSEVLLRQNKTRSKATSDKHPTHLFRVKAPLLQKNEVVCITGNIPTLGDWSTEKPQILAIDGNWWQIKLNLSGVNFPVVYKYGVYNIRDDKFRRFEDGDNRLLHVSGSNSPITIVHDGFVHLPNTTWKGAGVAIPVFSLRSRNSFGVGEFTDIKLLVDWANKTRLKLIQLLPYNDTMANFNWTDSYPYSAISAFALHPMYLNLAKVAGKTYAKALIPLKSKQKELNDNDVVDYGEVMKFKYAAIAELYELIGQECLESKEYNDFFQQNKHWLEAYAAFCYFRDKFGTATFDNWKTNRVYKPAEIAKVVSPKSAIYKKICLYYFTQFHLHHQLEDASYYAHKKGVVLKGDIPIGISKYSCDAWVNPEMYNMNWQAGAPPDDFTAVGQNWSFPTYNWKKMQDDGFSWWKQRFSQMSNYVDAFRIDHILGFFRIWSIPTHAVQGILGRFVPCLPVHISEFGEKGIWFDYQRLCRPFINDAILEEFFNESSETVKKEFLVPNDFHGYDLAKGFSTQKEVEGYFSKKEDSESNQKLKFGLFDLISNVILFEEENTNGEHFHFRISMDKTASFKHLIPHVREKLYDLYINYFYKRQDEFWGKEAMTKLPSLLAATNMLVCGEDLGMVPHSVPEVMRQLGILSLEIQRMPKDPMKEFFYPDEAPYLSVITPSTHDMSTIRGWWEENKERTQQFYNDVLGQSGTAPETCEAWINRAIVLQHLYSPAMWSVFQLQDILGMSEIIRRSNPLEERINNPANPKHYWQYRMHIPLEDLCQEKEFNEELSGYIINSGRG